MSIHVVNLHVQYLLTKSATAIYTVRGIFMCCICSYSYRWLGILCMHLCNMCLNTCTELGGGAYRNDTLMAILYKWYLWCSVRMKTASSCL